MALETKTTIALEETYYGVSRLLSVYIQQVIHQQARDYESCCLEKPF